MSVPVMIAMLARIQDQLQTDEVTSAVAADLAGIIAVLFALREEARHAMHEVEREQKAAFVHTGAGPKRLC